MLRFALIVLAIRIVRSTPVQIPTAWARLAGSNGTYGVVDFSLGRVGMIVSINAAGLFNASADHAFHVHVNAEPGADCSAAGPHLNPLGVDPTCNPDDSNSCELGVRARRCA